MNCLNLAIIYYLKYDIHIWYKNKEELNKLKKKFPIWKFKHEFNDNFFRQITLYFYKTIFTDSFMFVDMIFVSFLFKPHVCI